MAGGTTSSAIWNIETEYKEQMNKLSSYLSVSVDLTLSYYWISQLKENTN